MSNIVKVAFHGDELDTVKNERGEWVGVRRVCESLDVDMSGQLSKLKNKPWAVMEMISTTGPDGKTYETWFVHLDCLPMWLATVEASKVSEATRAKLIDYQRECARVLRDHFYGSHAIAPVVATQDLSEALSMIASFGTALMAVVNTQTALATTQAAMMESIRELTSGANGLASGRSFANQVKTRMTAFATYSGDGSKDSIRSWRTTGHAKLRKEVEFSYPWPALPAHRRPDVLVRLDDMVRLAKKSKTQDAQPMLPGIPHNDAMKPTGTGGE